MNTFENAFSRAAQGMEVGRQLGMSMWEGILGDVP